MPDVTDFDLGQAATRAFWTTPSPTYATLLPTNPRVAAA